MAADAPACGAGAGKVAGKAGVVDCEARVAPPRLDPVAAGEDDGFGAAAAGA